MVNMFKKFWKEEDGATIIEYILMLAVAAGIIALAFPSIKKALGGYTGKMMNDTGAGVADNDFGADFCTEQGKTFNPDTQKCT